MCVLHLCCCCGYLKQMAAVQIMMLLTQQHARPDILPVGSLPGGTWPGMREYILLMQVCRLDGPLSSSDVLCNGLILYCPRCPFDASMYVHCVCLSIHVHVCLSVHMCVYIQCVTLFMCMCRVVCVQVCIILCLMLCYGSVVKVHACMGTL